MSTLEQLLGSRIKELRENKNLTQIQLSKILNISNTTLCQYETGKRIPNDYIKIKIADYFNISLDYLLGRVDESFYPFQALSNTPLTNEEKALINSIRLLSPTNIKDLNKFICFLKVKGD